MEIDNLVVRYGEKAAVSGLSLTVTGGTVTSVLTEYARDGWGPGGDDFAWWCTEAPEAFTARDAVYRTQEPELRRMIGDELYEQLAAYLDRRARVRDPAPAAHPAQTPVALGPTRAKRR